MKGEHHVNYGVVDMPDQNPEQNNMRRKSRRMSRFTAKSLEERFVFNTIEPDNPVKAAANYVVKYYKPTPNCMKNYFFARFPFFDWIRSYSIKDNLLKDTIAGLTIGVVHIPQGMAYALMAGTFKFNSNSPFKHRHIIKLSRLVKTSVFLKVKPINQFGIDF